MTAPVADEITVAAFIAENWLNIVFGVIGIAGTVIGYVSWQSAKKSTAAYAHLFELADKHIDKSLTDKKLSDTKEQLKEEANRIRELQGKIQHEIPIEARRAVLRDKLETNIEQIHEVYISLEKAREQLVKLGEEVEIPKEIRSAIDTEIQPEYLAKRRKSDLRNYLTIITAAAAISSALLPYPFSRFASWFVLGVFGVPVTFMLIKTSWREWRVQFREAIKPFVLKYLALIGVGIIALGVAFFALTQTVLRYHVYIDHDVNIFILLGSIMLGIIAILVKAGIVTRQWWLTRRSTRPPSSAREL